MTEAHVNNEGCGCFDSITSHLQLTNHKLLCITVTVACFRYCEATVFRLIASFKRLKARVDRFVVLDLPRFTTEGHAP